jgi:AcrR family transcriptional regulator
VPKRDLRADAKRNRERVLVIAQQVFAAEGLAVPIDEIAKRAGVGIGTVYRHFPTKEALFTAIVEERIERLIEVVTNMADTAKPGPAFFGVLDRMLEDGAHKKDFVDALIGAGVDFRTQSKDVRARLHKALGALLKRAQAAGAVRTGVGVTDILALLSATLQAASRVGGSPATLFAVVRDGLRG